MRTDSKLGEKTEKGVKTVYVSVNVWGMAYQELSRNGGVGTYGRAKPRALTRREWRNENRMGEWVHMEEQN